ncbi:hypothetical protein GCM10010449_80560 [Streptomyces rectiviolaceus]|uniref:Transposase n=1 Tax=Streptomyces rectiviolaceus TaxID=332591 RepID=A0ABP6NJ38_9ACTN
MQFDDDRAVVAVQAWLLVGVLEGEFVQCVESHVSPQCRRRPDPRRSGARGKSRIQEVTRGWGAWRITLAVDGAAWSEGTIHAGRLPPDGVKCTRTT